MKKQLPDKILAKVTNQDNPIENLCLMISYEMKFKNSITVVFGPTNKNGIAEISKERMNNEINQEVQLALQDYASFPDYFTGKIFVRIMPTSELEMAINGYKFYKDMINFPPNYKNNLQHAIKAMKNLSDELLELKAWAEPELEGIEIIPRSMWRASWRK